MSTNGSAAMSAATRASARPQLLPTSRSELLGELKRVIDRLRYTPRILFEMDWEYKDGLNALKVNDWAVPLECGCVFEEERLEGRRLLRVRHPDPGVGPIIWTVNSGMEHLVALADDKAQAMGFGEKFADTVEYLRAWMAACSTPPEPAANPLVGQSEAGEAEARVKEEPANAKIKTRRRITAGEAESRVADYLKKHGKQKPFAVTIRAVVEAVGVSIGRVQKTSAWRAFVAQRKKLSQAGKIRTVPLSGKMLAVIPVSSAPDPAADELSDLIREQAKEKRDDERPRKRARS